MNDHILGSFEAVYNVSFLSINIDIGKFVSMMYRESRLVESPSRSPPADTVDDQQSVSNLDISL